MRLLIVNDKMQQRYSYALSAAVGGRFNPQFRPDLTPKHMLELGVFCGKYLTDCRDDSRRAGSRARSFRLSARDWTPAKRCRNGEERVDTSE